MKDTVWCLESWELLSSLFNNHHYWWKSNWRDFLEDEVSFQVLFTPSSVYLEETAAGDQIKNTVCTWIKSHIPPDLDIVGNIHR